MTSADPWKPYLLFLMSRHYCDKSKNLIIKHYIAFSNIFRQPTAELPFIPTEKTGGQRAQGTAVSQGSRTICAVMGSSRHGTETTGGEVFTEGGDQGVILCLPIVS